MFLLLPRVRLAAFLLGLVWAPVTRAEDDAARPKEDTRPKEVYQVRLAIDLPIIALGGVAGLLRTTLSKRFVLHTCPCDPAGVNRFDRGAIGNHSSTAGLLADITVFSALGVPPLLDLFDVGPSMALVEDVTVMSETVMVAILFQQVSNIGFQRPRPRTYALDRGYLDRDRGYLSFYAGHVSTGTAAVTAAVYTYRLRHGERIWPWLIPAAVGGSIAIERVASGHHFPSDVLAGLVAGATIGLTVPWLHARNPGAHLTLLPGPGKGGLSLAGDF